MEPSRWSFAMPDGEGTLRPRTEVEGGRLRLWGRDPSDGARPVDVVQRPLMRSPLAAVLPVLALLASCTTAAEPASPRAPEPVPVVAPSDAAAISNTATQWRDVYPVARRVDVVEHPFGLAIADPYRWLEDGASPDVAAWTEAEDHLARTTPDAIPERAALHARLQAL